MTDTTPERFVPAAHQIAEILQLHRKWLRREAGGTRADLRGADLRGADLRGADLRGADLRGADLRGADLRGADLRGADLTRADLTRADLTRADLRDIKADIFAVLDAAPNEVPAVLAAIQAGKIDGSIYDGACACLIGTIANARRCNYQEMPGLRPNGSRPAERWFLAIRPSDTPENHAVARITAAWIQEWIAAHPAGA